MIRLQRIYTKDAALYSFMEELLQAAFPPNEYRALPELRSYTDRLPHFFNNIIWEDDCPIGLITYWDLEQFYYVEHLAIQSKQRNQGTGKIVLEQLCQTVKRPLVLEVEYPNDPLAERRINFYKRLHFVQWEKSYQQPPYKPGDAPLPMYLMAYGDLDAEQDFDMVQKRIYQTVYKATTG